MKNKLNLEIKNYGPINNANIELNKINVIGGVNGSITGTIKAKVMRNLGNFQNFSMTTTSNIMYCG